MLKRLDAEVGRQIRNPAFFRVEAVEAAAADEVEELSVCGNEDQLLEGERSRDHGSGCEMEQIECTDPGVGIALSQLGGERDDV